MGRPLAAYWVATLGRAAHTRLLRHTKWAPGRWKYYVPTTPHFCRARHRAVCACRHRRAGQRPTRLEKIEFPVPRLELLYQTRRTRTAIATSHFVVVGSSLSSASVSSPTLAKTRAPPATAARARAAGPPIPGGVQVAADPRCTGAAHRRPTAAICIRRPPTPTRQRVGDDRARRDAGLPLTCCWLADDLPLTCC